MSAAVMQMPVADPARLPAAVLAALVHVLLFGVLFFGVRWSAKAPDAIVVELWSQVPVAEPAPAIEKSEPPPKVEPEPLPKPIPRAEPKPAPAPKKPDIAIERDKKQAKKDDLRFDAEARARMQEHLAREPQALAPDRVKRETATATAPPPSAPVLDSGYASRIQAKIRSNIVIPPGVTGNPEAIFDVVQLPDGDVMDVRLRKSSGFRAYDEAVERAIRKSSPLPTARRDQFQRQLELKFRPQE